MRIIPHNQPRQSGGPSYSKRVPKRTLQERMARQAAIERSRARYLHLVCRHYSTLDTDEGYAAWRPKKGVTWCENCSDWVEIAKPPAPPDYGDTPMF